MHPRFRRPHGTCHRHADSRRLLAQRHPPHCRLRRERHHPQPPRFIHFRYPIQSLFHDVCRYPRHLHHARPGLLHLTVHPPEQAAAFHSSILHERLAHISAENIRELERLSHGLHDPLRDKCDVCQTAKLKRLPFPKACPRQEETRPFELVSIDHTGYFPEPVYPSLDLYGFLIVDQHSRLLQFSTVPSKHTRHVLEHLKRFQTWAHMRIKTLRSDRAKEFVDSQRLRKYLYDNDIVHQTTAGYAPQQNSLAESAFRILYEMARSLLQRAKLPAAYLGYALHYSAWLWNRTIRSAHGQTPWQAAFGELPDLSLARVSRRQRSRHLLSTRRKGGDLSQRCVRRATPRR
mmetsp:Transcript_41962/g.105840  ORF Transcript_41962/g.105840 Transcript_41962/m.105840 type:complete len:347 (-) Transcript_41962:126-1166(-)